MNALARVMAALVVGYFFWLLLRIIAHLTPADDDFIAVIGFAAGATGGFLVAPQIARALERVATLIDASLGGLSPYEAMAGAVGLCIGLIAGYPMRGAYGDLGLLAAYGPEPFYALWLPVVLVTAFVGVRIGRRRIAAQRAGATEKLIDTSAVIDGRIVEIAAAGFLEGPLVVPRFVLGELQLLADSADPIRRSRGKRGLEVLERLRDGAREFEVLDEKVDDRDVDGKLITLARRRGASILTNDHNLNRIAKLQGIAVLNVHELSNAVKAVALPGEEMAVSIVKEGKEQNQGVGFLDDGTMVVVENGKDRRGEEVGVEVTSVLQTAAGRMIFAKLKR